MSPKRAARICTWTMVVAAAFWVGVATKEATKPEPIGRIIRGTYPASLNVDCNKRSIEEHLRVCLGRKRSEQVKQF